MRRHFSPERCSPLRYTSRRTPARRAAATTLCAARCSRPRNPRRAHRVHEVVHDSAPSNAVTSESRSAESARAHLARRATAHWRACWGSWRPPARRGPSRGAAAPTGRRLPGRAGDHATHDFPSCRRLSHAIRSYAAAGFAGSRSADGHLVSDELGTGFVGELRSQHCGRSICSVRNAAGQLRAYDGSGDSASEVVSISHRQPATARRTVGPVSSA